MNSNTPIETLENVGLGIETPLTNIEMPLYSGDIGIEELSPTLQRLILEGNGSGGNTIAEPTALIVRDIVTRKVVAETQDQTIFTIPFEDFEKVNCHLDIKINSVWINPERYVVDGMQVTLQDGVDLGKAVFFTCYYLGDCTHDGGYIQDVDVAETPEEVIVYDGGIIDEKVTAGITGHNVSGEAHADIRGLIDTKLDTLKPVVSESLNQLLPFGIYRFMNATNGFPSGYTADNDFILYNNKVSNSENWCPQILIDIRNTGKIYKRTVQAGVYGEWKEIVTADGEVARLTNHPIIEDFDTFTTFNEIHRVDINGGTKNIPSGADTFGAVINIGNADNTFQQVYYCSNGDIYSRGFRAWESPQWRAWKKVATISDLNNLVYRSTGDALGYTDGRQLTGEDLLPKYYLKTGRMNGLCIQLFDGSQLGGGLVGLFHVITTAPWHDTTGGIKQIAYGTSMYIRYSTDGNTWGTWQKVATTSRVTNLTLLNGWQGRISATRSGDIVTLNFDINSGAIGADTIITTLPSEYLPYTVEYEALHNVNSRQLVQVNVNGTIAVNWFLGAWDALQKVGCISYMAR